jgi:hypothetical protein
MTSGLLAVVLSTLVLGYCFAPAGQTPGEQPAFHPPVLIVSPHRLLDNCLTAEG